MTYSLNAGILNEKYLQGLHVIKLTEALFQVYRLPFPVHFRTGTATGLDKKESRFTAILLRHESLCKHLAC
jgi:hypothetical protein